MRDFPPLYSAILRALTESLLGASVRASSAIERQESEQASIANSPYGSMSHELELRTDHRAR